MISVLIISPDQQLRKSSKQLNDHQHNVFIAGTLKEGMRSLRKLSIDLVFIDEGFDDFFKGKWLSSIRAIRDLRNGQTGLVLMYRKPTGQNLNFIENRNYILGSIPLTNDTADWLKLSILSYFRVLRQIRERVLLTHELDLLIEAPQITMAAEDGDLAILAGNSRVATRLKTMLESAVIQAKPILVTGESGCEIPQILEMLTLKKKVSTSPQNTRVLDFQILPPFLHNSLLNNGIGTAAHSSVILQSLEMLILKNVEMIEPQVLGKICSDLAKFVKQPNQPVLLMSGNASSNDLDILNTLNPYHIHVEPLRSRSADLMEIADRIIRKKGLNISAEEVLQIKDHEFPGNLAELTTWLKRKADKGRKYKVAPAPQSSFTRENEMQQYLFADGTRKLATTSLKELEKRYLQMVLQQNRYNISESARILGISRKALYDKLKRYQIHLPGFDKIAK